MATRVFGVLLVGWKVRHWLRAFAASRRMRLFYERQSPEQRKRIEASWKQGSWNGVYTKPLPVGQAMLYLLIAALFLGALIYFAYGSPGGSPIHWRGFISNKP